MIRLKPGAELNILRKEIYEHLAFIEDLFEAHGSHCTITCGTDSHGPDDPHYHGFALDFRTHDLADGEMEEVRNHLRAHLGDTYYVLLEDPDGPNCHLHVQVRKGLWRSLI